MAVRYSCPECGHVDFQSSHNNVRKRNCTNVKAGFACGYSMQGTVIPMKEEPKFRPIRRKSISVGLMVSEKEYAKLKALSESTGVSMRKIVHQAMYDAGVL